MAHGTVAQEGEAHRELGVQVKKNKVCAGKQNKYLYIVYAHTHTLTHRSVNRRRSWPHRFSRSVCAYMHAVCVVYAIRNVLWSLVNDQVNELYVVLKQQQQKYKHNAVNCVSNTRNQALAPR